MITILCPHCGGQCPRIPTAEGKAVECQHCHKRFIQDSSRPMAKTPDSLQALCLTAVGLVAMACFFVSGWLLITGWSAGSATTEKSAIEMLAKLWRVGITLQAVTGMTMALILAMLLAIFIVIRDRHDR